MGAAYFIVLDRPNPGFDTFVNGKALSRASEALDKVAKELGLRTLDGFVSYSPDGARGMMEDLGASAEDVAKMDFPDLQWFDAAEGIDWVDKVAAHLRADPTAVKNSKGVLSDLEEYRQVLDRARAVGARWDLQVDL